MISTPAQTVTATPTTTVSKQQQRSEASTKTPKIAEYSFASEALVPSTIFASLAYFVHRHSGDAISNQDLIFSIGFLLYVFVANAIAFNNNQLQFDQMKRQKIQFEPMGKHSLGRGEFITQKSFLIYFGLAKVLMVLIPLGMLWKAPTEIATMAAPSLLVVLAQAVAEQSTAGCHDVLRMVIPIAYSTYRLFGPLQNWALDSYDLYLEQQQAAESSSSMAHALNVGVAWANLVLAAYNLFGFLILRTLPVYFDKVETPRVEMKYTLFPIPKKNKTKAV